MMNKWHSTSFLILDVHAPCDKNEIDKIKRKRKEKDN